jgi:integrase
VVINPSTEGFSMPSGERRTHDHAVTSSPLPGGVPVHVVAAHLGHADPAITLRVYAHVIRSAETAAADVFAQTLKEDC